MVFEPSTAWRVRLPVISYKWWGTSRAKNRSSQREAGGEGERHERAREASEWGGGGGDKSRWRAAISTGTNASHHLL